MKVTNNWWNKVISVCLSHRAPPAVLGETHIRCFTFSYSVSHSFGFFAFLLLITRNRMNVAHVEEMSVTSTHWGNVNSKNLPHLALYLKKLFFKISILLFKSCVWQIFTVFLCLLFKLSLSTMRIRKLLIIYKCIYVIILIYTFYFFGYKM